MTAKYRFIPLCSRDGSLRAVTVVDQADFERFGDLAWHVSSRGYVIRNYREAAGRFVTLGLHRLILGLDLGDERQADHINRDRLDNRRSNLRVVTPYGNQQNRIGQDPSRHRCVRRREGRRRWEVEMRHNRESFYLGAFDTEAEAIAVAQAFRRERGLELPDHVNAPAPVLAAEGTTHRR